MFFHKRKQGVVAPCGGTQMYAQKSIVRRGPRCCPRTPRIRLHTAIWHKSWVRKSAAPPSYQCLPTTPSPSNLIMGEVFLGLPTLVALECLRATKTNRWENCFWRSICQPWLCPRDHATAVAYKAHNNTGWHHLWWETPGSALHRPLCPSKHCVPVRPTA